jgi:endonuclease/exonuclease/phosphatase family metal-dependent hydrolase
MKNMVIIFLTLILSVFIFIGWAAWPWSLHEHQTTGEIKNYEPKIMVDNDEHPSVFKIFTWNLGFLYGEGSEGPGYLPQNKNFYDDKLKSLGEMIKEKSPDVVCLQEIDFDSQRSFSIDQAEFVAKAAGYPYVAEASSWSAHYIPFPYWPIARNFGRMKSGGAVLSKYPIVSQRVTLLKKPHSNPWWYNLFYLHRYFQKVVIDFGDKRFSIINLHLEAFDKADRKEQIQQLLKVIKDENIDFICGDFNMVPKNAIKRSKFFNDDDYENDPSAELMQTSGLGEVIPDEINDIEEARYFTYPSSRPDRRLDYIFYRRDRKMMKAEVFTSALSDHLPIGASFQIDSPRFNPYSQ